MKHYGVDLNNSATYIDLVILYESMVEEINNNG